jgi:crossover junction endodeoxyribonuclease RuvC
MVNLQQNRSQSLDDRSLASFLLDDSGSGKWRSKGRKHQSGIASAPWRAAYGATCGPIAEKSRSVRRATFPTSLPGQRRFEPLSAAARHAGTLCAAQGAAILRFDQRSDPQDVRHGHRGRRGVSLPVMKSPAFDTPHKRILGIDPGLRATGFGVIEQHGQKLHYVASGVIRSREREALPERIATLFAGISSVIAEYRPTEASVEIVFVNVNPQSTLLLGQARGAALAALTHAGLPVAEYTALQVKQAVVGQGKAAKQQVAFMVTRLLELSGEPASDAADGLACAITHAWRGNNSAVSSGLSIDGRKLRVRGGRYV